MSRSPTPRTSNGPFSRLWLPLLVVAAFLPCGAVPAEDPGGLDEAQRAAAPLLLDRLLREDPGCFERIRRCPPRCVLLVEGVHDHTDRVLGALGIPFRRCSDSSFAREPLDGVRLVIVDCPGRVGEDGARRLRAFVERGGTLLTTDWSLLHVLEVAFPGLARYTRSPTRDDVVRITRVHEDPLLRWVFPRHRLACWWLENQSYPVEVLDRRRVHVLLESDDMGRKYGSPIIGFTFRWGPGRVVHLVSHTYLQRNELRDPWELRPAAREAAAMGLSEESPAFRRLKESGALDRVAAGHLNSALSIQQLLLNVALASLDPEAPPPEPPGPPPIEPAPPPPELPVPVPPPPGSDPGSARSARETQLRAAPGGDPVLHVARGLRLAVLERRGDWVRVATPAGQVGWLRADGIERS